MNNSKSKNDSDLILTASLTIAKITFYMFDFSTGSQPPNEIIDQLKLLSRLTQIVKMIAP